MRVLIIEDEVDLATSLRQALEEEGFAVDVAEDGEEGLVKAREVDYDALLLDLMLPGIGGLELLETLRREGRRTPVLVLTARDGLEDKLEGFERGADDYLTKPFTLEELVARIRALIRRSSGRPEALIEIGGVQIDLASRTVRRAGQAVTLAAKEYALLEYLALHRGQLITRAMLYDHIYDETEDTLSNVLNVYVANLRRKLGDDLIETRRGQGYLIPDGGIS